LTVPATGTKAGARLPSLFWVVWAGTLVNRAATFVAPFLMLYLVRDRGVDPVLASVLLSVQGIGLAVSNLIGGWLADRIGRRPAMVIGLVSTAVIAFLLPAVSSLIMLAVLVTALGLVSDLHRPALNALVADVVPVADRPRAYSLLHWAINLGMSVAMIGGGRLATAGYEWLFRFDALSTLAFAAVIWVLVPRRPVPLVADDSAGAAGPAGPSISPWRDTRLLTFALISFLAFTIYFQNYVTLPLAITDQGLSVGDFGTILAVNGIVVAVLQPLLAGQLGRFRQSVALTASYLLIGLGFGLTAFASGLLSFGATVAMWSIGEIVLMSVGTAYAVALAPADRRGRYLGVYGAAVAAAASAAPLLGSLLYQRSSALLWGVCAALGVALGIWQLTLGDAAAVRTPPQEDHEPA
jgi:MFS family permease